MQVLKAAGVQLLSAGSARWLSHQIFMRAGQTAAPPRLSTSRLWQRRDFSHQATPKSVQLSAVDPGGSSGSVSPASAWPPSAPATVRRILSESG
jgi:hypothetical protein